MKITATPLYQAISKKLNNHERQELIAALQVVKDMPNKRIAWNETLLITAFGWMDTPQSYAYWDSWDKKINHAN